MENLNNLNLITRLQDLSADLHYINEYLENGKIVHCHRKVQGMRTKLLAILCEMQRINKGQNNVAEKTD